jgi:hypothetical protein
MPIHQWIACLCASKDAVTMGGALVRAPEVMHVHFAHRKILWFSWISRCIVNSVIPRKLLGSPMSPDLLYNDTICVHASISSVERQFLAPRLRCYTIFQRAFWNPVPSIFLLSALMSMWSPLARWEASISRLEFLLKEYLYPVPHTFPFNFTICLKYKARGMNMVDFIIVWKYVFCDA